MKTITIRNAGEPPMTFTTNSSEHIWSIRTSETDSDVRNEMQDKLEEVGFELIMARDCGDGSSDVRGFFYVLNMGRTKPIRRQLSDMERAKGAVTIGDLQAVLATVGE